MWKILQEIVFRIHVFVHVCKLPNICYDHDINQLYGSTYETVNNVIRSGAHGAITAFDKFLTLNLECSVNIAVAINRRRKVFLPESPTTLQFKVHFVDPFQTLGPVWLFHKRFFTAWLETSSLVTFLLSSAIILPAYQFNLRSQLVTGQKGPRILSRWRKEVSSRDILQISWDHRYIFDKKDIFLNSVKKYEKL